MIVKKVTTLPVRLRGKRVINKVHFCELYFKYSVLVNQEMCKGVALEYFGYAA